MQRYLILARFNHEGNRQIGIIGERFSNLQRNFERFGGRLVEAAALLGAWDMMVIFEAPDLASAKQIDMAGRLPGMVETVVLPMFGMEAFQGFAAQVSQQSPPVA